MLFRLIVQATLVAAVLAQSVHHQHHQHDKKDVVYHIVTVTSSAKEESFPTAQSERLSGPPSALSGSFPALAKGITYSPYDIRGCKSKDAVAADIKLLHEYEIIRIYGVDCNQVRNVLGAMSLKQRLFAGIYDMKQIPQSIDVLAEEIKSYGWDRVDTVAVGNEEVNSGQATVDDMRTYLEMARLRLAAVGFNGDIVSVDTCDAMFKHPDLSGLSDYLACNLHPYFDDSVSFDNAGEWAKGMYDKLGMMSRKKVVLSEIGWPTDGNINGLAVPSVSGQKVALADISRELKDHSIFFTAYDDLWKKPGKCNCEQNWGIYPS